MSGFSRFIPQLNRKVLLLCFVEPHAGRRCEADRLKTHRTILPCPFAESGAWAPPFICLDTYMLCGVYREDGNSIRDHCGAEPPSDTELAGLVGAVGGRDRASASDDPAHRIKAPASAARGGFCGIHGRRAAPSLPAET